MFKTNYLRPTPDFHRGTKKISTVRIDKDNFNLGKIETLTRTYHFSNILIGRSFHSVIAWPFVNHKNTFTRNTQDEVSTFISILRYFSFVPHYFQILKRSCSNLYITYDFNNCVLWIETFYTSDQQFYCAHFTDLTNTR